MSNNARSKEKLRHGDVGEEGGVELGSGKREEHGEL